MSSSLGPSKPSVPRTQTANKAERNAEAEKGVRLAIVELMNVVDLCGRLDLFDDVERFGRHLEAISEAAFPGEVWKRHRVQLAIGPYAGHRNLMNIRSLIERAINLLSKEGGTEVPLQAQVEALKVDYQDLLADMDGDYESFGESSSNDEGEQE